MSFSDDTCCCYPLLAGTSETFFEVDVTLLDLANKLSCHVRR